MSGSRCLRAGATLFFQTGSVMLTSCAWRDLEVLELFGGKVVQVCGVSCWCQSLVSSARALGAPCGINCGSAALCWSTTTIGLYECLNVPFFVRCASLGPDNGFI